MSHLYSGTALVTLTPAGLLERDMRAGVNQNFFETVPRLAVV